MENIIVAISNLPALGMIKTSYNHGDYLTSLIVIFLAYFSFVSHLFMSHKHGMTGFGINKEISKFLNYCDVFFCFILGIRFLYLNIWRILDIIRIIQLISTFCLNLISESTKSRRIYIITHSWWHILIFWQMDGLLSDYYTN